LLILGICLKGWRCNCCWCLWWCCESAAEERWQFLCNEGTAFNIVVCVTVYQLWTWTWSITAVWGDGNTVVTAGIPRW